MLGSLLMAAALPEAFGERGLLFAASYVALQVGRNAAAAWLLTRRHRLRDVFERLVVWSAAVRRAVAGRRSASTATSAHAVDPALALELAAPAAGYWLPGPRPRSDDRLGRRGRTPLRRALPAVHHHRARRIDRGHRRDRFRGRADVDGRVCLVVAFVETAALWWLYFGATAERARVTLSTYDDPGRLARDAYTYLHLPIVAGIIATAVGNDLLIAEPHHALHGVGLAMILGGPAPLPARGEPVSPGG